MNLRKLLIKFNDVPIPYYVGHIIFALLIAAIIWPVLGIQAGLVAGAFFYIGREFTQWEEGLSFDWKGLIAPVAVCTALIIYLSLN